MKLVDCLDSERICAPFGAHEEMRVREELERILQSRHFKNSRKFSGFLSFVVEKTLSEDVEAIKERLIGIEVFQRPLDYDTASDPIVRISAGEVRKRLAQYYESPDNLPLVRLSLPVGSYRPEFVEVTAPRNALSLNVSVNPPDSFSDSPVSGFSGSVASSLAGSKGAVNSRRTSFYVVCASLLVLLAASCIFFIKREARVVASTQDALSLFWHPMFDDHANVLILYDEVSFVPSQDLKVPNTINTKEMIPYSEALAVSKLVTVLDRFNITYDFWPSSHVGYAELQRAPSIFVSTFTDNSVRFQNPDARFRFYRESPSIVSIHDSNHPEKLSWKQDLSVDAAKRTEDYAVISRRFSASSGTWQITIVGLTERGLCAASRLITSSQTLSSEISRLHIDLRDKQTIEILISTPIINGSSGQAHVVDIDAH